MDVFWLSLCIRWSHRFTVDINTEIPCSRQVHVLIFCHFCYGNPPIIAAENGGDGSHCTNTTSIINTTNASSFDYLSDSNHTTVTVRTCSGDAHVAQGVAFFLQNFFILLRLVILHTHIQLKPIIYNLFYTVLLYSSLEEQKKIQTAFECEEKLHIIIDYTQKDKIYLYQLSFCC